MEEEEIYHLSPEELEAVNEGIWQIENGFFISNEEANKRAEEIIQKYEKTDLTTFKKLSNLTQPNLSFKTFYLSPLSFHLKTVFLLTF
jgi:hypothetical protein